MSTDTQRDTDRDIQIAQTIRSQIAIPTFMTLGASDLMRSGADFTFKARIIPKGYSSARVMRVTVHLNPLDLYDITVVWSKTKFSEILTHFEDHNVYADQLNRILFALDCEG
jgi:hypothetical protein